MLRAVTDLGDSAFLIPASILLFIYLLYLDTPRTALIWAEAVAICILLTAAVKIGFRTCALASPPWYVRTPSGHTSFGTTFYLCSALMLASGRRWQTRLALLAAGAAVAALIGASRVLLHDHTVPEVAIGFLVGAVAVAWFASRYRRQRQSRLPWRPAAAIAVVMLLIIHGHHLDFEAMFGAIAASLRAHLAACP